MIELIYNSNLLLTKDYIIDIIQTINYL